MKDIEKYKNALIAEACEALYENPYIEGMSDSIKAENWLRNRLEQICEKLTEN